MRRRRSLLPLAATLLALTVTTTWPASADRVPGNATADHVPGAGLDVQQGVVRSGDTPIGAAEVTLYRAGDRPGAPAEALARGRTDGAGRFRLGYHRPADPRAVLYLFAERGRGGPVGLAAVLGSAREHAGVAAVNAARVDEAVVNERTTVAAAYALARFAGPEGIAGGYPGLQNAAAISHNLADVADGGVARVLATAPNGAETSTLPAFNTLADILAGCVDGQTCAELFRLAGQPGQPEPANTFEAAVAIAHGPGEHVGELFALAAVRPLYRPALPTAPDAWTLALRYTGNGHEINGPGNIAFDADGNAWVTNNYEYAEDPRTSVCGGRSVLRLSPTGEDVPGAPYRGGGLYGAGYGITLDPKGDVWVGNFGFQGSGCPLDPSGLYRSVSQFGPDGAAKSPAEGWRSGGIVQPQGTVSDRDGNIWIADCGGRSVTVVPHGDPQAARRIAPPDGALVKPFDLAVDGNGQVWVTGNGSDSVLQLSPEGEPVRTVTGGGITNPLGVATDSGGNAWVANSGVVPLPCEDGTSTGLADAVRDVTQRVPGASVTVVGPDGTTPDQPFVNDGLFLPWGIAVDGDDTVWVANFGGHRVARLCGTRLSACPPGYRTGQAISPPDSGYTFDGLSRNTAVQIDPSGNVWLANNWQTVPLQTNPGGRELVVFIGLAAPVCAPLIGPPQQP
ncbi:NHL repeat-containing protein [Kitasatospora sp. NPDC056181]|uniref:NHL repeat-containing protein n=1 Tax=Kitasatospora sp. NPDC056181 TaxID=3345737 RepID=UPI0035DB63F4